MDLAEIVGAAEDDTSEVHEAVHTGEVHAAEVHTEVCKTCVYISTLLYVCIGTCMGK